MTRVRGKRWCFTLNNPTEEEREYMRQSGQRLEMIVPGGQNKLILTYLVFGEEMVSTLHLQGYVETSGKTSMSVLKKCLSRAHWEKARGTSSQASEYCKKDGTFEEFGEVSNGQGFRTDLEEMKEAIINGASEEDIADQYFSRWLVYRRSIQAYIRMKNSSRDWETKVHVYWGKTGTGKTRFVMDQVMDSEFWSPGDYKWFDGYVGQPIVILDDYRGEYALQLLLKLLDRYAMTVPVKGGFTEWMPRKVYITSNIHPNEWYPNADRYSVAAMFRRLHLIESVFDNLY